MSTNVQASNAGESTTKQPKPVSERPARSGATRWSLSKVLLSAPLIISAVAGLIKTLRGQ